MAHCPDPADRWATLAEDIHHGLSSDSDWPALARTLQSLADNHVDVAHVTRAATQRRPLSAHPAQDLRYRLITLLPIPTHNDLPNEGPTGPALPSHRRQDPRRDRSMLPSPRSHR